jgi:Single-stranded DNA binding protein Ssb-like, OB fold
MRNKVHPSEYLAFLTVKYDVDPDKFFNALVLAAKNRKSQCGDLSIELRSRQDHKLSILITQGTKVVAQFHISEEFLLNQKNPIKAVRSAPMVDRQPTPQNRTLQTLQIKDLRVGMKKVNLLATVLEISEPSFVVTRFGNCASVANAMVSDETGKIKLCLWNDQIKLISVGDTVQIENGRVSAFKNERQMRVGKRGVLKVNEEPKAIN